MYNTILTKRNNRLINEAESDPVFALILEYTALSSITIKQCFWGPPGYYVPKQSGITHGYIRMSYRHDFAICTHIFLHELMHIKQESEERLLTPDSLCKGMHSQFNKKQAIMHFLACEAEAEAEAIAGSWRLKEKGNMLAWQGALRSREWKYLAHSYDADRTIGVSEEESIIRAKEKWYEGRHMPHYHRLARKLTANMTDNSSMAA